jgi:hypothetical protein
MIALHINHFTVSSPAQTMNGVIDDGGYWSRTDKLAAVARNTAGTVGIDLSTRGIE